MPPKSLKRKASACVESSEVVPSLICILHKDGSQHVDFTPLSKVKGSHLEQLKRLKDIRDVRLQEPLDSPFRMEEVCHLIPDNVPEANLQHTGYHRGCYQIFTKNLNRLKGASNLPSDIPTSSRPQRKASANHLFPATCIFCEKLETQPKGKTERCVKFAIFKDERGGLIEPAWKQIETQALEIGDHRLYGIVQGQDLFAREAQYHPSCRKVFHLKYLNSKRRSARAQKSNSSTKEDPKAASHQRAFNVVLDFIQENVIGHEKVIELTLLRRLYVEELQKCGFPNPEFRAEKLKINLEKHEINKFIQFAKVNPGDKGCITFNIVYSANMSVNDAICNAYKLGSTDKFKDVACTLRDSIVQAFKKSQPLPWPPSADDIPSNLPDDVLPHQLIQFLNYVICGNIDEEKCAKSRRIVLSIGQDICRAATSGDWKLPKHILLCTTLRHLYRSKQLTIILNRLGHCETYDFSLELETAIAKALDDASSLLTPQIVTGEGNEVLHLEWDNMNKITTNVHGSNTVNSTAGIIIQEVKPGFEPNNQERTLPVYKRNLTRSLKLDAIETLAPVHIYTRAGPKLPEGSKVTSPVENNKLYEKHLKEYQIWVLARIVGSNGVRQVVPGFGGFISATGIPPPRKSTIEYMTPIHEPFTEYSSIKELLKRSEEATNEVGQEYVLNTFDLGGCMKALPLIWKSPEVYKKHVVIPGPFHTCMNYMGMVTGKKCKGSGYADILLESGLVTSGCLKNVLKGKAYAKALFCLKTVSEAMERLLIERFIEEEDAQISIPVALFNLTQTCTRDHLNTALGDPSTLTVLQKYVAYQKKVRDGHLGKTAKFWMNILDHTSLLLMLQYAVKTNNLSLFHKCNGEMANLFFAFDGPNYSRYLVWLDLFLTNIDKSHPGAKQLLQKGGIAVARSLIPGSLCAVDKTMEETFMKFAKSTGGFSGIFSMFGAYQRWCRSTSTRAQYYEKMLEMCGLINDPDCPRAGKHRELEKAEIKKSEEAVQRTMTTICNFTNPFTLDDKDHLYSLASGAPVPYDIEVDILNADETGKTAKAKFIKERFVDGSSEELFFEPIKRTNLKTMDATNKVIKLTASQGKVVQYRQQSDLAFMLLIKSQNLDVPLNLDELMKYSLTPVPYSLGTADGYFNKTNKAAMLQFLTEDETEEVPYPTDKTIFIQDGNALFHALSNLGPTFGAICLQLLDHMVAKTDFVFSTDSYHSDSIKSQERLRRGFSQRYIVEGPATRKPLDFKLFLANDDNKTQLCHLLLRVWSTDAATARIKRCGKAIVVVEGKAYQLVSSEDTTSIQELEELMSNQEETDTRVVLYLKYAASLGYRSAVVRTPDTDIFVILLHHAVSIDLTIYLDTGTGKKRKIVNVSELASSKGPEYCSMVLGFYVYTGEDVTSAFKGKGKVAPMKKLQKHPKYHAAFISLGDEWSVHDNIIDFLEEFTCVMYGYPKEKSINSVRSIMLKKMVGDGEKMSTKSKIDLSRLPPCKANLVPHIQRVNHRLAIYKRAHIPVFWRPNPYDSGQGWEKTDEGFLEPIWSSDPILPPSLIELIESTDDEDLDEDEGEDEDLDYDDLFDEEED